MMPVSAEVREGTTRFRVWAPPRRTVELVVDGHDSVPLIRDAYGYFCVEVAFAPHGTRYRYRLDGEAALYPDPASRAQPEGPHGPSQVVDPGRFAWADRGWRGARVDGQVLYEMHVGTFTKEGTWARAQAELPWLVGLGVTAIEMMPVAEFPGAFGWGYDGVSLFAPYHGYGEPDDLRRFVDRAHALGLAVILDVVYNHLGPDGNYLGAFSRQYFDEKRMTDWGPAIRYAGAGSAPVRELFVENAVYWIREYHFDGLRFDATQDIRDDSEEHVLSEMARTARAAVPDKSLLFVAESESQDARLARPTARGGHGLDAVWNDDYHHSARVALTGRREAYYGDYDGSARELVAAIKRGYLYQGQRYAWQGKPRGSAALDLHPEQFVTYLENHDQVANGYGGRRLVSLTSAARLRAMTALWLLGPGTPLLFQGQERGSSAPFHFFADHRLELGARVKKGRADFCAQFASAAATEQPIEDPGERATFERSKLDDGSSELHALHGDLLALRREQPREIDAAPLSESALVLRGFGGERGDRLLLVNLGKDLVLSPASEPLLAPPEGAAWTMRWSSEDPRYGGGGAAPVQQDGVFRLPAESSTLFVSELA
jgi:maltooligosyltrehalose trehalohydrolase